MPYQIDQATLNFVQSQLSAIEAQVYETQYAEIQYPALIPVDTTAPDWVQTVTYYSMDRVGAAEWAAANGDDFPTVGVNMQDYQTEVHMAHIGYAWNLEEINQARMLGIDLSAEKAIAARRAYEEFIDSYLLNGTDPHGVSARSFSGLINYPGVTIVAAQLGAGGSTLWANKTADEVLLDINNLLGGVYIDSQNIEIADTLLLSEIEYLTLANKRIPNTSMTLLKYILDNNILKMRYNKELTIRVVRGLETAGVGGLPRAVAYKRDPSVMKAHIPMPLQFMPMETRHLKFTVPGIFRFGGLDIRRMGAIRYLEGI